MRLKGGVTGALFVAVVGVAACGDPETNDTRGYTKAPLENPSVVITPEPAATFEGMNEPVRPPIVDPNELASRQQQGQ